MFESLAAANFDDVPARRPVGDLAHAARRGGAYLGDGRTGRAPVRDAAALRRPQRDRRPGGGLVRAGRPGARAAGGDARALRRRRAPLRRRAGDERADGRPAVRRPDPVRARPDAARPRASPAIASGPSELLADGARRGAGDRHGPARRGGARPRGSRRRASRRSTSSTSIDFMIDEVASERPDIAAHAAPDGQVTILFSDIEDSTLMTERLGDERWLAGAARPQRALPPPGPRPRRLRGQEPGRRVHARLPGSVPGARVRGGDPARARRARAGRGRAGAGADGDARRGGDPRGGRLLRPQRDPRGADRGRRRAAARSSVSEELKRRAADGEGTCASTTGASSSSRASPARTVVYRADWEQVVPA